MRLIISLIIILTDKLEVDITQLNTMFYDLSEKESMDEKFIEKSSSDGIFEEDLNEKSNEELLR